MVKWSINIKSFCLAVMWLFLAALPAMSAQRWLPVQNEATVAKTIVKDNDIEILTTSSHIIIHVSQPSKIEVFTILGRLISSESVSAGSYEMPVESHGVYIIKIGDMTCKVVI